MGDNFLEAQAKNTKKRRAKASALLRAPKLLVRADQMSDRFTVDFNDGCNLKVGELLLCFACGNGAAIDVARGHERVGEVGHLGGASALIAEIDISGSGCLRVVSVDELGQSAQVELVTEDGSDVEEF